MELLFLCAQNTRAAWEAEAIISMLIANGSVQMLPALRESINQMVEGQLLKRVENNQGNQSRIFNVTASYRNSLRLLQEMSAPGGVTTRQRVRS